MLNAPPPRLFADIHTEDEPGTAVRLNTHLLLFFKRVAVEGGPLAPAASPLSAFPGNGSLTFSPCLILFPPIINSLFRSVIVSSHTRGYWDHT